MRLLGQQFVLGRTIGEALANAREREARGYRFSFDMLGEAAMTDADAQRYLAAYEEAIHAIGAAAGHAGVYEGPGISIKLSALHPRYARAQRDRVISELYPRVRGLAELARGYDIGLNIDAEEADRLDLSLDLFERLAAEPSLDGWLGLGFVVQAYQKRARRVDRLADRARAVAPSPPDGAPRQRGVLGHRDQARAGRRPVRLSRLHAQGAHRRVVPRVREGDARGARRAVLRNSQATTRSRSPPFTRWRATRSSSSSACTAWANRCTTRWSATSSWVGRAESMRR